MISEVVIPFFTEGMEDTLVAYRDFQTKDGYADQFLEIIDRVASIGGYPIDTVIDIRTSIGLSRLDSRDRSGRFGNSENKNSGVRMKEEITINIIEAREILGYLRKLNKITLLNDDGLKDRINYLNVKIKNSQ